MCTSEQPFSREQLKIIAIRPLENCPKHILRALHPGVIYYLNRNFQIDSEGKCKYIGETDSHLPCEFFSIGDKANYSQSPLIHLNAIVGKNGDGKSSLIELLMRIINNLSNRIFTEAKDTQYEGYYIENLHAELYYAIEKTISLSGEITHSWKFYRIAINGQEVEAYLQDDQLTAGCNAHVPVPPSSEEIDKSLLEKFFYTMVSNYSIFAYNVYDYCEEWVTQGNYESCWLYHLFHKNDGYQLPIVLHPFRDRGNININTEHNLIKSRLITLLIEPPKNNYVNFRVINEKQTATSIQCTLPKNEKTEENRLIMNGSEDCIGWTNRKYVYTKRDWLERIDKLDSTPKEGIEIIQFDQLEEAILKHWSAIYDFPIDTDYSNDLERKKLYYAAKEYLVYKTISVTRKYKSYLNFLSLNPVYETSVEPFGKKLTNLFNRMANDPSHVTLKIRQTIAFLKFQISKWDCTLQKIPLDDLYNNIHPFEGVDDKGHTWELIDLLPPPIFEVEINLLNNQLNQTERFSALSSGERQLVYSVSSILYHLRNLNSVKDNFRTGDSQLEQGYIHYAHTNIILEEVELYFHPEFQCQYVQYLLNSIYSINLRGIESINITFVTHSPFVLSDIPLDNVLFLKNGLPVTKMQENTFGANIYNLYKNGFFLDGAPIGGFAKEKIRELFNRLQNKEASPQLMNEIKLIGEPLIKNQLIKLFNKNIQPVNGEKIKRLEEQIKQLKSGQQ